MATSHELHHLVKQGNVPRVRELLKASRPEELDINAYDRSGQTPLMHAAKSQKASVELVRLLLDHGANVHHESHAHYEDGHSIVALSVTGGDPQKVTALIENGADIHYKRAEGYDALIDAVHARDVLRDPQLIDLLKLLIASGVALSTVTSYDESGIRTLSRLGRFDAVRLLLDAGADATHLKWTRLIRAVALGTLAEVEEAIESGANLEERDWWERTAWLVAIQTGDVAKARFLLEHGAVTITRGRCGEPSLFYAIENHHAPMLNWLLEIGTAVEQTDDFGTTALMAAVECGNVEGVDALLKAGADVNIEKEKNGRTAISSVRTRELAIRLLDAGADPGQLQSGGQRALLGFDPDADDDLLNVSLSEFLNGRLRRFGVSNPEKMIDAFCEGMIRTGISAYQAAELYEHTPDASRAPVWCAQRFGQSITLLPDGRIIQVGGEHEDSYDSDFCIYNDVFVHEQDGALQIFGYPESVFPPTDFHTATLVDKHIYLIGSLGYQGTRQYGKTPVYRLSIATFRIEPVQAGGEAPGWIFEHRAIRTTGNEICVFGGKIVTGDGDEEAHTENKESFVFDTERMVWRREEVG
jgi:ankyrin repeat protein